MKINNKSESGFKMKFFLLIAAFLCGILPALTDSFALGYDSKVPSDEVCLSQLSCESADVVIATVPSAVKITNSVQKRTFSRFCNYYSKEKAKSLIFNLLRWVFVRAQTASISENRFIHSVIYLQTVR